MKKTYIAPEMEIKKFSVEDIMTTSANVMYSEENVGTNETVTTVNYDELFNF